MLRVTVSTKVTSLRSPYGLKHSTALGLTLSMAIIIVIVFNNPLQQISQYSTEIKPALTHQNGYNEKTENNKCRHGWGSPESLLDEWHLVQPLWGTLWQRPLHLNVGRSYSFHSQTDAQQKCMYHRETLPESSWQLCPRKPQTETAYSVLSTTEQTK